MTQIKVTARMDGLQGQEQDNIFWLNVSPDINPGDEAQVLADIRVWLEQLYANVTNSISTAITAVDFIIHVVDLVTAVETFFADGPWTWIGAVAGEALPPQMAGVVTKPLAGSKKPSHTFIGGITELSQNAGLMSAGALAELANFGNDAVNIPVIASPFTYRPNVYSRTQFAALDFTGAVEIPTRMGTQRRRKLGVGS